MFYRPSIISFASLGKIAICTLLASCFAFPQSNGGTCDFAAIADLNAQGSPNRILLWGSKSVIDSAERVGFESTSFMERKEFCGAARPSK
jgi:hypothetical protein